MWSHRALLRLDWKVMAIVGALMVVSLLVISATDPSVMGGSAMLSPKAVSQLHRFVVGWGVFLFFAGVDYNKIREWAWVLYVIMCLSLLGLFFTEPIQNVHRWYRVGGLGIQPSEYAKLSLVIALSWFLERNKNSCSTLKTALLACLIVSVPFLLILKEPDLGTALVLGPIALVMFYMGDIHRSITRYLAIGALAALLFILSIFLGVLPYDTLKPYALKAMKEYQYERLDPSNHHQKAALIAIGVGGLTGSGWKRSEFTSRGWLPYGYTDSVFPAFGEEFGLIGLFVLLVLFYALIYCSFQVVALAKDHFGRMLSAGIAVYIAMHILVNIGMMCGLLPITGVPLILVSFGGSSIFVTMAALGIVQSIYARRFMF